MVDRKGRGTKVTRGKIESVIRCRAADRCVEDEERGGRERKRIGERVLSF